MAGRAIDELAVGEVAEFVKVVTREDIDRYARATGDANPLHLDPAFARRTVFGEPIAQGMLSAGIISAVLGTRLPGPGTIYLAQDLRFIRPVKIGNTITARVEVIEIVKAKNRVRLKTTCRNQQGEEVLVGTALVMPPASTVEAGAYQDRAPWTDALACWQRLLVSPWEAFLRPGTFFGPLAGTLEVPWVWGGELKRLSDATLGLTRRVEELARTVEQLGAKSSQMP